LKGAGGRSYQLLPTLTNSVRYFDVVVVVEELAAALQESKNKRIGCLEEAKADDKHGSGTRPFKITHISTEQNSSSIMRSEATNNATAGLMKHLQRLWLIRIGFNVSSLRSLRCFRIIPLRSIQLQASKLLKYPYSNKRDCEERSDEQSRLQPIFKYFNSFSNLVLGCLC